MDSNKCHIPMIISKYLFLYISFCMLNSQYLFSQNISLKQFDELFVYNDSILQPIDSSKSPLKSDDTLRVYKNIHYSKLLFAIFLQNDSVICLKKYKNKTVISQSDYIYGKLFRISIFKKGEIRFLTEFYIDKTIKFNYDKEGFIIFQERIYKNCKPIYGERLYYGPPDFHQNTFIEFVETKLDLEGDTTCLQRYIRFYGLLRTSFFIDKKEIGYIEFDENGQVYYWIITNESHYIYNFSEEAKLYYLKGLQKLFDERKV